MGRVAATVAIAVLAGCGSITEEEFEADYLNGYCELLMSCTEQATSAANYQFENTEECEAFIGGFYDVATADCEFDKKQAKDCSHPVDQGGPRRRADRHRRAAGHGEDASRSGGSALQEWRAAA